MNAADIARLANQMIALEKDPQNEELSRKHLGEWLQLPYSERWQVVQEARRIEASAPARD